MLALFLLLFFGDASAANRILFVTDEPNMAHARRIKYYMGGIPPFPNMRTLVGIKVSSEPLAPHCHVEGDRLLICKEKVYSIARKWQREFKADVVLVIVNMPARAGAGTRGDMNRAALATVNLEVTSAVHELMHTFNFSDEYAAHDRCAWGFNAEVGRRGGAGGCNSSRPVTTIMGNATSRCIPVSYWPQIAKVLGVAVPAGRAACGGHSPAPYDLDRYDPYSNEDHGYYRR